MRRARALALAATVAGCAGMPKRNRAARVDEWRAPLIVLSGFPRPELDFVLYASGRVLYPDAHIGSVAGLATVALTDAERAALLADLPLGRVCPAKAHR